MGGRSIARALARVQSGETTFDGFVRETAEDWRRLSQETFRRWPLPAAVERQDVEQEMLMAAWRATGDYDATRGTTIEQRVVWCAVTDARKFLHRQRNSYRRDARAPGRFEVRQEASDPEPTVEARQAGFVAQEALIGHLAEPHPGSATVPGLTADPTQWKSAWTILREGAREASEGRHKAEAEIQALQEHRAVHHVVEAGGALGLENLVDIIFAPGMLRERGER